MDSVSRTPFPQESPLWNSALCNHHDNILTAYTDISLVFWRAVVLQSRLRVKSWSSGKLISRRSVMERRHVQRAPGAGGAGASAGPAPAAYAFDELCWPQMFIVSQQSCTRSTTTK